MTDELNKYTFEEFVSLELQERDLYKTYGLSLRGRNITGKPPLEWEWARIKQIQDIINKPTLSYDDLAAIISLASCKTMDEVMQMYWPDIFGFYNFIIRQIEFINEREEQLAYEPEPKEVSAGIENYKQYGWFGTLYRLAGGDPLKYDAIGQQPYSVIFSTLMLQKTDAEFNKALIKQNSIKDV